MDRLVEALTIALRDVGQPLAFWSMEALSRHYSLERLCALAKEKDAGFDGDVLADALRVAASRPEAAFTELGLSLPHMGLTIGDRRLGIALTYTARSWRTGHQTGLGDHGVRLADQRSVGDVFVWGDAVVVLAVLRRVDLGIGKCRFHLLEEMSPAAFHWRRPLA